MIQPVRHSVIFLNRAWSHCDDI